MLPGLALAHTQHSVMMHPEREQDVHVWPITSDFPALPVHVLARRPVGCHRVRGELEQLLCQRSGLGDTTVQVDHAPDERPTIADGRS